MGALAIAIIKKAGDRRAQIPERQNALSSSRRRGLTQFLIQATLGISHAFTKRARCRKWVTLPILPNSKPSQRRPVHYNVLFGFAAVGAFLLALPAAAMACVSQQACTSSGGTVIVFGGTLFCSGGALAGQNICPGGSLGGVPTFSEFDPIPDTGIDETPMSFLNPYGWLANPNQTVPPFPGFGLGGPPVSVSLYSSSGPAGSYAGAGVAAARNSGYQVTDSNGAVAGQLPGFHSFSGSGGINFAADGTSLIGYNGDRRLLFSFNLGYTRTDTSYGTSVLTPGLANAGSVGSDRYTFAGSVTYGHDNYYLNGNGSFDFTHDSVTNNVDGGTGNSAGHGYSIGAIAGDWIPLYGNMLKSAAMPTKAPPTDISGRYAVFLNLSGSVNYLNERANGFTDTAGFIYGTEKMSYTDLGAKANLVTVIPSGGFSWMPFIGLSIDRELGFNSTFDVPAQGGAPEDTLFIGQSNTFWGTQGGVNIVGGASFKAGVSAFYMASADTKIVGGNVFLKIPFFYGNASAEDSGITEAKK